MGSTPDAGLSVGRRTAGGRPRGQWLLVAGFVVLAAIVVGLAYWAWRQQAASMRGQAERSLQAVGELKANQIATWLDERLGDAEIVRGNRLLSAAVADVLAGRDAAASAGRVRSYLAELRRVYGYTDVLLVSPAGRVVVATPVGASRALTPRERVLVAGAQGLGKVAASDLHRGPDGRPEMELVAPVLGQRPGDAPIADVLLGLDPAAFLYPYIQHWPLPSTSGETLLVEQRGDRVVYLNELRHRKGTALRLSIPLADKALPAAMAVSGRRGIVHGVDYRGVPVMAALEPVPGTQWYVVSKVDTSEVLDPIRRRGWLTAGFTLLIVGLAAAGTLLLWRARESQTSAEIRASEEKYRSFFELTADLVAIADLEGNFRDVNAAWTKTLGYSREELLGRPYLELVHPDDREKTAEVIAEQLKTEESVLSFENRYLRKDGSVVWLEWTSQPRVSEGVTFSIARDVTERRRAEEAIRDSEATLRAVLDATPFPVALVDAQDDDIAFWSDSALALFGHTAPTAAEWYQLAYPDPAYRQDVVDRWKPFLETARRSGRAVNAGEYRVTCSDGSVRICELYATFLADRLVVTFNDITARKRADEARGEAERSLAQLNVELEQRVVERTQQLDAANKELEAFAYSVSHDLRAPLRHISGFSALLAEHVGDGLDEKSRHYVDTIARSVREMGVLIDDLLQFSRSGRTALKIEPVDMAEVLREALGPLQQEAGEREIEWAIGRLPRVSGDHALLRQVWVNLLGNAVKYTRGRAPAHIQVGARDGDRDGADEDVFWVRDDGVGFDMQYAHKLFGVFQRLHGSSEFEGTGIGLANVQRIVTRLGGRVWAEGELERGATFYFSLPRSKETRS